MEATSETPQSNTNTKSNEEVEFLIKSFFFLMINITALIILQENLLKMGHVLLREQIAFG